MRYQISLEAELEVNKLLDAEAQAKASSEYDMMHLSQQLENKVEAQNDIQDQEDMSDTETQDDVMTDNTSDTNTEENSESSEANDVPEDTQEEPAIEALKALTVDNIATEGFFSDTSEKAKQALQYAVSYLYDMGVTYGPSVASKVYKGVIYSMGKLADLVGTSIDVLVKYIDKRLHSFKNLQTDIKSLQSSISELKAPDTEATDSNIDVTMQYRQTKVINMLKISDSIDIVQNIEVLKVFVDKIVKHISTHINEDIEAMKHLIAYADSGDIKVPSNLMLSKDRDSDLSEGTIEGFSSNSDLVSTKYYAETLPGDVKFIYYHPVSELTDIDDIREAYNNANMFLGHDRSEFKSIEAIPYMTSDDLNTLLEKLNDLCDVCISHQTLYEQILRKKQYLKLSLRDYFKRVISKSERVSMRDSLLLYMQLKQVYIDKVYIAAMMDVHNYTVRVISSALTYVKANIKSLS